MNKQDMNNKRTTVSSVSSGRLLAAVIAATLACGCEKAPNGGAEHPGGAECTVADVAQPVESYVKQESKDGGFKIKDPQNGKQLSLTLDRVHRERLSQVGPDMFFACADFKAADGTLYDLDFFVQGKSKDNLRVLPDKTSVHKENGKERYTWALDAKKGIWEQKPVGTKAKEHLAPEHP